MAASSDYDRNQVKDFVSKAWNDSIYQALCDYIRVPNQSPLFDPECLTNGLQEKAMQVLLDWLVKQPVKGMKHQLYTETGRTPVLLIIIDGSDDTQETILMYGHMDKQPPMDEGWNAGTGPRIPVLKDGKLYGRGGADDGYAIFAAITSIRALQEQNVSHSRIVLLIEACEESGSKDLPYYVDKLSKEIASPSLVICLDSGCHNYEQLWLTTSLRGVLVGTLTVRILDEAVHSGMGSGIVPSSFRIIRQILDRLDDSKTGVTTPLLQVEIPEEHKRYANEVAATIGDVVHSRFRFVDGAKPVTDDLAELLLNATWRPTVSVVGCDGIPTGQTAGNVVRCETSLKISVRLPPTLNVKASNIVEKIKELLESNPPYGAKVSFKGGAMAGWCAPKLDAWLEKALNNASLNYFDKPVRLTGEGGSIPFMGMLGEKFPTTQFVITGVLGPLSNAHASNEFLHVRMFHGVTGCVAHLISEHYKNKVKKQ